MKTKTNINAGGVSLNHAQTGLATKTGVKAGGLSLNHNQAHGKR